MHISTSIEGESLIVRLKGDFDLHSVPEFRSVVIEKMNKKDLKNLVLSLKEVNFIDSSGLGAILGRYRDLKKKGGQVMLVNLKPQVRKVFHLSGLLNVMDEYDQESKALEEI